ISTVPTDQHPTGYIVSNSEDLLTLFDADYGVLVIGEGAKILGPNEHGQDILLLAEYLRVKQFTLLQVSQSVMQDYPDLQLPSGLDVVAGLLFIPLSMTGKDFLALLRKGQAAEVNWAGRPPDKHGAVTTGLEPRTSFKLWTERLVGRCRAWTDEQLDTAAVLALVYGKFIEVWRQKESAVQMNQMTTLLLSNTSHEVRTPLHQIINYLELALDGKKLDDETRDNLTRSHAASKALLFTINDLLDLTRLEVGKETSFNEPFDLSAALQEAVKVYQVEATRRQLEFQINLDDAPRYVVGDSRKIKTVVANLTSNAVKYTRSGSITVTAHTFEEPEGLRPVGNVAVEIVVSDTGCGIQPEKLESIFREFEQVDTVNQPRQPRAGLGLGLAVVARVVEQLGGQLRVDSKIDHGSRFSCLLPFTLANKQGRPEQSGSTDDGTGSGASAASEIDSLVEALSTSHMIPSRAGSLSRGPPRRPKARKVQAPTGGRFEVEDSVFPVRGLKVDEFELDAGRGTQIQVTGRQRNMRLQNASPTRSSDHLRILIVEDDLINSRVLKKRLASDGHDVVSVVNGQQAVDLIEQDRDFDCVLMDIQMPILDGFGATKSIRDIELTKPVDRLPRRSTALVGRIPVFAVSASLTPDQRPYMMELGMDGWVLKPIEFKRLATLLASIGDISLREQNAYRPGMNWEYGGWLKSPETSPAASTGVSTDPSPQSDEPSSSGSNNPGSEFTAH
ncbi:Light-sensor Protein kinase, partial [Serendipita sp. 399]